MINKSNILIISTLLSIFVGCKDKSSNDPAQLIVGRYKVSYYIVDEDTLISPEKGNVSQYPDLSIEILRKNDENVAVFLKTSDNLGSQTMDNIYVRRDNGGVLRLTMPDNTISTDFGYADGKNIFLKGAGWNHEKDKVYFTTINGIKF